MRSLHNKLTECVDGKAYDKFLAEIPLHIRQQLNAALFLQIYFQVDANVINHVSGHLYSLATEILGYETSST